MLLLLLLAPACFCGHNRPSSHPVDTLVSPRTHAGLALFLGARYPRPSSHLSQLATAQGTSSRW
jgi:hypothetical protein